MEPLWTVGLALTTYALATCIPPPQHTAPRTGTVWFFFTYSLTRLPVTARPGTLVVIVGNQTIAQVAFCNVLWL